MKNLKTKQILEKITNNKYVTEENLIIAFLIIITIMSCIIPVELVPDKPGYFNVIVNYSDTTSWLK